ncbi:hypothetical protein I2900191A2_22270 [Intestinibacter bartlettii]
MDTYSLPSICQVKNLENIITINIKNRTIVKIYLIKILNYSFFYLNDNFNKRGIYYEQFTNKSGTPRKKTTNIAIINFKK